MDMRRARRLARAHPHAQAQARERPPWTVATWGLEDSEGFGFYVGPPEWAEGGHAENVPTDPVLLLVDKATGKVEETVYLAARDRVDAMTKVGAWPELPDWKA